MEVVRSGLEALHFVASDIEWPEMDKTGKLSNVEGCSVGPEVAAFHEVCVQEAAERTALLSAAQNGDPALLPALPKTAATARQSAQAKFAEVMAKVRGATVVPEVFPKELLADIDGAYKSSVKDRLANMADPGCPLWMEAMRGYQETVRTWCARHWSTTLEKLRETTPNSPSIRALENAPQKLEWLFEMQRLGLAFSLPLPTQTFISELRTKLVEADAGIAAVSHPMFHIIVCSCERIACERSTARETRCITSGRPLEGRDVV